MAAAGMDILQPHLSDIRIPKGGDKIYKDECVFSFDNPETEAGLFVCLNSFLGFGRDHVERYHQKTGRSVFLHIKRIRKEIPLPPQGDGPEKKITRLAIGVEGGFDPTAGQKKFEFEDHFAIVVLPSFNRIELPNENLPEVLQLSVKGIMSAESATKLAELEALAGTWDGEVRKQTKHAQNLLQLPNGKKIPPRGWQCEKCDLVDNLWLNLTDGSILCGRRFHDGTGGNNHAVEQYKQTGFPLAVKLGTITSDAKADVYSYDEDDMVEDPFLVKHLAHWGINVAQMEKTEKSMAELELDLNQRYDEWSAIQEAGSQLKPVYGPGCTGLENLGNSCYLNSVMQVLFTIPGFQKRFVEEAYEIYENAPADPANDFNVQVTKLGVGLLSGKYSQPPQDATVKDINDCQPGISPHMFKSLIGRGHPDFSTKKQQDAQEFFLHFINVLERNSRHKANPANCFKFKVEDRVQCSRSHQVKYTHRTEYSLPLPIPMEAACNKEEVAAYLARKVEAESKGRKLENEEQVRPKITLASCLEAFSQPDIVEQFYSTAVNERITAQKTTRLASFPDYLLIHLKKFTLREDWVPMKLDIAVEMPDILDLSSLRAKGLQPGEEVLPELHTEPPAVQLDETMVQHLMEMGFPPEACKKAVFFSQNQGIEAATNWIMEHIGDSDFDRPFVPPGTDGRSQGKDTTFTPNEEALAMIMSLGFSKLQATQALKATDNNVERAADWVFSHAQELDAEMEDISSEDTVTDGGSKYKLVAFISHMGTSTMVGHYVCHILKGDQWVIFNDNKVALSEHPPKDLGYLYLYQRL